MTADFAGVPLLRPGALAARPAPLPSRSPARLSLPARDPTGGPDFQPSELGRIQAVNPMGSVGLPLSLALLLPAERPNPVT